MSIHNTIRNAIRNLVQERAIDQEDQRKKANNPVNIVVDLVIDRINAGGTTRIKAESQQFYRGSTLGKKIQDGLQNGGKRINRGLIGINKTGLWAPGLLVNNLRFLRQFLQLRLVLRNHLR